MKLEKWKGIYEQICWDRALVFWKKNLEATVSQRLRNTALDGSLSY